MMLSTLLFTSAYDMGVNRRNTDIGSARNLICCCVVSSLLFEYLTRRTYRGHRFSIETQRKDVKKSSSTKPERPGL